DVRFADDGEFEVGDHVLAVFVATKVQRVQDQDPDVGRGGRGVRGDRERRLGAGGLPAGRGQAISHGDVLVDVAGQGERVLDGAGGDGSAELGLGVALVLVGGDLGVVDQTGHVELGAGRAEGQGARSEGNVG